MDFLKVKSRIHVIFRVLEIVFTNSKGSFTPLFNLLTNIADIDMQPGLIQIEHLL